MSIRTILCAGLLAPLIAHAAMAQSRPAGGSLQVDPLGSSVYLVSGGVANSGFIIGDRGVIVVDAEMFMPTARQELADIAGLAARPVNAIILTHSDPDHINGLAAYPPGVRIIAQENAKAEIERAIADPKSNGMPPPPGLEAYLPTQTVRDRESLVIDGVRIELLHLAPAHTDGDLIVYLPDKKIVFAGDLLTPAIGPYPGIHLDKHGSSLGWIAFAKAMLALDADTFISGHGQVLDRGEVASRIRDAEQRRAAIKTLFDQHKSLAEAKALLHDQALPGLASRFPTFVETTWQELAAGSSSPP